VKISDLRGMETVVGTTVVAEAFGMSPRTYRQMVAGGCAPVMPLGPVGPGHTYVFATAEVIRKLGLDPEPPDPGDPVAVPDRDDAEPWSGSASVVALSPLKATGRGRRSG